MNKINTNKKIVEIEELLLNVAEAREQGRRLAFTNGCFDLFHAGHLKSFEEGKNRADILIVAVNSDTSVKSNKGDLRPIIDQYNRAKLVAGLEVVDWVVIFNEKSPSDLISLICPDVYIKGSDWMDKVLPEQPILSALGTQVVYVEMIDGISTTIIIEKIKEVY